MIYIKYITLYLSNDYSKYVDSSNNRTNTKPIPSYPKRITILLDDDLVTKRKICLI